MTFEEFQAKYEVRVLKRVTTPPAWNSSLEVGTFILGSKFNRTFCVGPWEISGYEGDSLQEILERLCSRYREAPSRPTAYAWYQRNPDLQGRFVEWTHGWAFLAEFLGEHGRMDLLSLLDEKEKL